MQRDSSLASPQKRADPGTSAGPLGLSYHMPNTTKFDPRPLFTPSTLPEPAAPDPVVAFIEDALLTIANRQDEVRVPEPPA